MNEVRLATVSANTVKDICQNLITKGMDMSNIEIALKSIIEQR